jgi:hypothetical protein
MKSEADVQREIRLVLADLGVITWRNNSGVATDKTGRPVRFGLGNDSKQLNDVCKSSDIIGIIPPGGWFLAIEVKREDWIGFDPSPRERAQQNFIRTIAERGGFGMFAKSADDVRRELKYWLAARGVMV